MSFVYWLTGNTMKVFVQLDIWYTELSPLKTSIHNKTYASQADIG